LSLQTLSNYKILTGLALFAIGTFIQIAAHMHLKNLRRHGSYSLPTHPLFMYTLTPHYFAECVEYLGLSVMAAPPGKYVNKTIVCALVFIAVNLGVTAHGTRQWYARRFGQDRVEGRARMIPMVW
jgi:3-oxo-5-alpha-steroid 4-dehydrogenase 3